MRSIFLILLCFPLVRSDAASSLQFVPSPYLPPDLNEQVVIPLPNGSVLIAGSVTSPHQVPTVSILNSSGIQTGALATSLGSGDGQILDAAIDPSGNIWIVGTTNSDDFPLVQPLFTEKIPYQTTGFVAKLDSNLNLLFSTFLGGQGTGGQVVSTPTKLTIDASGNAYIAGHTGESSFPTTGPVLGTGAPGSSNTSVNPLVYAFVVKISADGSQLLYGSLLGGNQPSCPSNLPPNELCVPASTIPYAMALDASGSVTLAGSTNASNFPVTANAYQATCSCPTPTGFVARVSPDGSKLAWSTFLGNGSTAQPQISYAQSIAPDSSDNVYVVGFTYASFPASPGALQMSLPSAVPARANGYAVKLSSDGTKLLYSTNLGGSNGATLTGLTLDQSGNVWITGHTNSSDFPGVSNISPIGIDFALKLNADASALDQFLSLVPGTVTQPPAYDSNGNLLLLSSQGNLLRLDTSTYASAPAVLAVTNAAVLTAESGLAPGEIATFFGVNLGPSSGIVATPDENGLYPTELGGVTVQFAMNGLPPVAAPLLYVGSGQINFQVPFRFLAQGSVTVTTPTTVLPSMQISQIASPGIFQQDLSGFAAALNQDGSVNSMSNPAKTGSIVSLFVTGFAQYGNAPFEVNGAIAQSASPISLAPSLGIEVLFGDWPLPVLYAGAAPGLIDGVFQINVELPQAAANPEVIVQQVQIGGTIALSNTVQVYAQ